MKEKIQNLKWYDIFVLTALLFGYALYTSTVYFFELIKQNTASLSVPPDVASWQNYQLLFMQLALLFAAVVYLKRRRFDFSVWTAHFSFKALMWGLVLFAATGLCMDMYLFAVDFFTASWSTALSASQSAEAASSGAGQIVSSVLYAIVNGTYEELFFLGICLAVPEKYRFKSFLFSLLVRFGFHTYMGLYTALGIAVILGIPYFVLYTKFNKKNLIPYFIAHALADVFGLSFMRLLYFFY